mmetsp:Transcript_120722/g.341384  ORF Transcript_120722/g.341384 Transcript_120722/m.341384 type:complete len:109 (-) Transcript_120722:55-381(-)
MGARVRATLLWLLALFFVVAPSCGAAATSAHRSAANAPPPQERQHKKPRIVVATGKHDHDVHHDHQKYEDEIARLFASGEKPPARPAHDHMHQAYHHGKQKLGFAEEL